MMGSVVSCFVPRNLNDYALFPTALNDDFLI